MANTSAWVVGYSTRSLGLLTSIVTSWGLCGWVWMGMCVVWDMCVVWTIVSTVVKTWPPAVWDEPSAESFFLGLFLGGILRVFFQAHPRWAPMLGFDSRRLTNSNEGVMKVVN
jgi:hypothetical protein